MTWAKDSPNVRIYVAPISYVLEATYILTLGDPDMELILQKKKLIEKFKKARTDQEISQLDLAKMLKTKQPAIARMESGLVNEVSGVPIK